MIFPIGRHVRPFLLLKFGSQKNPHPKTGKIKTRRGDIFRASQATLAE